MRQPIDDRKLTLEIGSVVEREVGAIDRRAPLHNARIGLVAADKNVEQRRNCPRIARQKGDLVTLLDREADIAEQPFAVHGLAQFINPENLRAGLAFGLEDICASRV